MAFVNSHFIDAFQIIEGNSELSIVLLYGEDAREAFTKFVSGKGIAKVIEMIGEGRIETVRYEDKYYFNIYF